MTRSDSSDRRQHPRHPLATTVQLFHGPSRREFPARSIDVSSGGMLVYVPVTVPIARGHAIQIRVGSHSRPELPELSTRPITATVVRVDRKRMMQIGHLPIGIRFETPVG